MTSKPKPKLSLKLILLSLLCLDFVGMSIWVIIEMGYVGVFEWVFSTPAGWLTMADMGIALGLVSIWLYRDATARGVSPVPYLVLTAGLGSAGPLLYLIRREQQMGVLETGT